jgi:MoaA/NifB/PqqE/SkfB family radical SAM enzyme
MGMTPRFTCPWIFETLVVLSDGKVVCGCADPYGERPLGDAKTTPLYDIWNSDQVRAVRRGLNRGYAPFCEPCGLKCPVAAEEKIPQRPERIDTLANLFVETSVGCNLDCFKSVCNRASGITETRSRRLMPYEEFTGIMDQAGEKLSRLDYFNYGEPFVHAKAVDMLEYVKSKYPHVYCYTSTNGLLLNGEKNRRLVDLGMDEITFSVDGPDQETYEKYRRGGRLDRVIRNMKHLLAERNRRGKEYPLVNWRYILFNWNDSRRKMNKTRRMARRLGVDRLVWEITDHPEEAKSEKYQVGTTAWEKIYDEIWDTNMLASAIRNRRYLARLRVLKKKRRYESGRPFTMRLKIRNTGTHHWQKAAPGFTASVRLGGQLFDGKKRLIDQDFARAFIPEDAPPGKTFVMDIDIPAIEAPGRYCLKFDMVSEGLFWFEKNRSPAAWAAISIQ